MNININKAIEHFNFKLNPKNKIWKATESDINAINSIIDFKEIQESVNLSQNESLAKLWIHQLILLSNTGMYNGERSIQIIDEILNESVYSWCIKLKEQIPMMRFNSVGLEKYPLGDVYNITEQRERNEKIISEFETELTKALKHEISEENIIKFVSYQVNRIK